MGVTLTREFIRVDQVVGEERRQSVVEGIITLPNGKPDIERVISITANVNTESLETDILDDKVVVDGEIDVDALYVGDVPEGSQPVHFVEGSVDFSCFAKIPGAKKNMDVRVKVKIEHVQFSFDPQRPREIKVRIIIECFIKVTQRVKIEVVIDATGPADLQVLRKALRVEDVIGEAKAQNIVKSDVTIPEVKPDIEQVLKVEAKAHSNEVKIIDNKIIIEGVLEVGILYVADVSEAQPQQPVHFVEIEVPFTQFVEIPGAKENFSRIVRVEVEHIKARKKDDRTITVEAILNVRAKVYETKVLEIVLDVFSPSEELEVEKTLIKVDQVIGEDENQIVVKEHLTVPPEKPPIEQIYKTNCRAEVTEARILDGKIVVEGKLIIETLYVADVPAGLPQQPLHFVENEVEFTTFVEIPGALENMTLDFDLIVERCNASVDRNDNRKYEVRAIIALRAKVTELVQLQIVTDVIEPEEEEKPEEEKPGEEKEPEKPSMTIYIVQRGDTLWSIAKRYNVTVDSIVKANNITQPDMIMPGQQLVIPRTM
ncbi:MAG TPA: DUF3794 domain-containing protein [Thermoanaerobacterales bacterium]|jgi:hypothetical protein|nr:DUF3794 domain-containing protein [Thermoanaerobacterales bacterium]